MAYEFTGKMGQISGFGGGYEEACRNMLRAGLEWLDLHPDADPQFHGYKNIYGIVEEDNDDARKLSKAVTSVCEGCTGAMHQAVIYSILWIKAHSWEEYVREMTPEPADQADIDAILL